MKATLLIIALGSPAASLATVHVHVPEPALMVLSGAALLALGTLLRRAGRPEIGR